MIVPPRNHTPRNYTRATRGGQIATLAAAQGAPLLPWQRAGVDVALEIDPDTGLNWYDTVVVTVQRQAGKTKLIGDVATHRALTKRQARIWYTAQLGRFASSWMRDEHFEHLAMPGASRLFGAPGTAGCRYQLSRRNGQEGVFWLPTRSSFMVFPPVKNGLHSKQGDLIFVDEAWAHSAEKGAELRQAIRPTMNTRPGAQQWIVSAAGDDGSEYLAEYVELGLLSLQDPDARVCFIDYGIPDDGDPEDLDLIAEYHPAFGAKKGNGELMLDMAGLIAARADFGNDSSGWARAYGTRRSRARRAVFPAGSWAECRRPRPEEKPKPAAFAIDSTPDEELVAIAAAWAIGDGAATELVWMGPSKQAGPVIAQLDHVHRLPFAWDSNSPAMLNLVEDLAAQGIRIKSDPIAPAAFAADCNRLARHVIQRQLVHFGQEELDEAVEGAARVDVGDGGFRWRRTKSTANIAPLVAITLAVGRISQAAKKKPVGTVRTGGY